MLTLLASLALVPPPPMGDSRTEILFTVNALVEGLTGGNRAAVQAILEPQGSFVAVDSRKAGAVSRRTTSVPQVLASLKPPRSNMVERIGVPTLMQRGDIASVWAPYAFAVDGKPTHCGMDSFHLVRRDGKWRVASLVYTIEPLSRCAELAAPDVTQ